MLSRAFSAGGFTNVLFLGRCPRLEWNRALGADTWDTTSLRKEGEEFQRSTLNVQRSMAEGISAFSFQFSAVGHGSPITVHEKSLFQRVQISVRASEKYYAVRD
jgi:hypothetical protein